MGVGSGRPEPHYCGTCRTALDSVSTDGRVRYEHTRANLLLWTGVNAHAPVPVPMIETDLKNLVMRCDVDNSTPTCTYIFDFTNIPAARMREFDSLGPDWSLCDGCAALVESRDVAGLLARALDVVVAQGMSRKAAARFIQPMYETLLSQPFRRAPLGTQPH